MALGNLVKQWETIMRDDDGVNGTVQVLSQLVWMLFLKVYDIKEDMWELYEDDFTSALPEECRWRNWAKGKSQKEQMTGDELVSFVNNTLFPTLKDMAITAESSSRKVIVHEMMVESFNYMKDGVCIRKAINLLDSIEFDNQDERHAFNDIYETLLRGLQSAGHSGEFYTPRALTQFITEMVNPKLGEVVADFACGTGGFLVDAVEHLKKQVSSADDAETIEKTVFGVEKKQFPYMLCTTNMLLHDVDYPQVMHMNSLAKNVRDYTDKDKVDVILMNPPYGGHEQEAILTNFPALLRSSETANLFMIEIMYRLNDNGRCGIILPDGFLQNDDASLIAIKEKLFKEYNVHTIIRLPGSCFAPYTSINTNLVFFEKTGGTTETWFYRFDLINGQKFSMKRNPITLEKLSAINEWWDNRVEIKDEKSDESLSDTWKSQCVSIDAIAAGQYNLDFCGFPNEEKVILSPEEVLSIYVETREKLEKRLSEATTALGELLAGNLIAKPQNIGSLTASLAKLNSNFPTDLRGAILQAAMQGKLTEQLESDTPVDILLDEIKPTITVSTGRGRKKSKQLEIEFFDIPQNWKWVKLSECGTTNIGLTYSPSDVTTIGGTVVLRSSNIQNGCMAYDDIVAVNMNVPENKMCHIGDILICARNGSKRLVGKSAIIDKEGMAFGAFMAIYRSKCNPYINYVLDSPHFRKSVLGGAETTTINQVTQDMIENYMVPLPPIEEQQRIVERLDALLPLCDTLVE